MNFSKKYKKIIHKSLSIFLLCAIVFPLFPQPVKASPVTTVLNYTQLILTEGTTWTVPSDWNNASNTVEVIGGGGAGYTDITGINGTGGGGGGGYSKVSNISLTPGEFITYQVGIGGYGTTTGATPPSNGTDSFFGRVSGTAGTCADVAIVCAKGGFGATSTSGAGGGMTSTASGTVKWAGGNGGTGNTTGDTAGGGGGAGGPDANGKTGGAGGSGAGGGSGGGGGNGGSSSSDGTAGTASVGGKGGAGNLGTGWGSAVSAAAGSNGTTTGAGGGGGDSTLSGGNGAGGTNLGNGTAGTGGGGGGGSSNATVGVGGNGGLYGAGGGGGRYGGKGAPGVIVITYGSRIANKSTWVVPWDWNDDNNTIETIGAGGAGFSAAQGSGTGGGGGGGYSKSLNQALVPGATSTYAVGLGGRKTAVSVGAGLNGGDTYFCNSTSNCASLAGSAVISGADGGLGATSATGATGGASSTGIAFGIGLLKTSGGAGGTGNGTGDSGGGGGGAAGTSTVGQVGGIGYTSASGGGGGGGGAGGCTGAVGGAGVAGNGGAGGNGPQCSGSGALGANAAGANGGLNTGAGGGGGDSPFMGGRGSNHGTSTYGGGGGGGAGDNNRVASGTPMGGDGGYFGGGGGGGIIQGFGGNGGIIIIYEPLVITASSTGTQTASITNGTVNNDMGANFTFISTGSSSVTSITLTESGTIDASSHLDNIKLYYDLDTSAPYNCASESLSSASAPSEAQFGSTDTDGFSSANGTSLFTGSARVSATTTMCTYVILDVLSGASGSQTIELSIASASDFTTNRGTEVATTAVMPGTTTIAANAVPTVTVTQPDGTSDTIAQDASYNITYTLEDTDDIVTAEFFYDTNASGLDGVAITGPCATAAEGTGVTCAWDTTGVTPGTYYVYASTTDTINSPVTDYSSGVITINARPTITVSQPDGTNDTVTVGDSYNITYTSADSDDTVATAFYYDSNGVGLDGVAITGPCATAAEGTGVTCAWDTTGVTPGTYYVYGIMNDGVNASVNDYSSGQITINPGVSAPTVSTQAASSITATGATLNGTIVSDGGASSTVRGFAWGTAPTLVGGDTATTTENGTFGNGTFTNSSLTLVCNTTYYSRAYATNPTGTGFGAVSDPFTTSPCKPTVTTQSASSVGALTATLNGTIVSDGGASSTVRGFAWGTAPTLVGGDTATTTENGTFGNGTFSTTTLTFVGNTTYYSRAYAVNSAGTSSGAISSGFLTLPGTPGTPTASVITATTLTVNWSAPTGGATTYKIERCTGSSCSDFAEIATGVGALTYGQSSLSAGTTYRYRVRGTNATGDGAYATSADITTSATATTELSAYRFFDPADSYTPGTALAIQNTPVTLTSPGDDFRMRLLIHFGTSDVAISERSFKLQYAVKSGTCDTSFTGESYFDATTTSPISYKDSTGVSDDNALGVASDITHGGDTIVNQTYEEANNFTNSQSGISSGQDGKWDFSLYDNGATEGQSYCLRVVQSDGSVLSSYSQIPEVAIPVVAPSLDQLHYRWRNDNGSESSATYAENEDTTLSSGVFIGDRKRLRFVLSNVGSGPATDYNFKIEYATTACSLWSPVASYGSQNGEHFSMDTTGNSSNAAQTSNMAGLSDPAGPTFLAGLFQTTQNQTGNFSLPANRFTELEYSLKSTASVVADTTYCFRLTHAGSITNFVYSLLPRLVISPTTLRPSGGGGGNAGGEAPADPPGQQQTGGGGGDAGGNAGGEAPADPPGQQQTGGGSGGGGDSE